MNIIKIFKETFNEILGNTDWFECRMCRTKVSKENRSSRYLNSRFLPILFSYMVATFVFFLIFNFINGTFFEYFFYFLGFGFLFILLKATFNKAEKLEKEDIENKPSCPNCEEDYLKPIVKNPFYPIIF